jgi:hypothetical protein
MNITNSQIHIGAVYIYSGPQGYVVQGCNYGPEASGPSGTRDISANIVIGSSGTRDISGNTFTGSTGSRYISGNTFTGPTGSRYISGNTFTGPTGNIVIGPSGTTW